MNAGSVLGKRKFDIDEDEVWITDESGLYEFSDEGRIRNTRTHRIIKATPSGSGSNRYSFYVSAAKKRTRYVAPDICTAFHGKRPKGHVVVHLDGDVSNDFATNLVWKPLSQVSRFYSRRPCGRPVRQLTLDGQEVKVHVSALAAAASVGRKGPGICNACSGKQETCAGFRWEYVRAPATATAVDLPGEEWKDAPARFDAPAYAISNKGRVKNKNRNTLLRPAQTGGYLSAPLTRSSTGRVKLELVHRLVAYAFLGEPPEGAPTVDHINGDKQDNRVENLRWLSCKDNITAAKGRRVGKYTSSGECIATYPSIREAGHSLAVAIGGKNRDTLIGKCVRGRVKSAYGFVWRLI